MALAVRPKPGGQLLEGFPPAKEFLVETSRVGLDCAREHTNVKLVNIGGRRGTQTPRHLPCTSPEFLVIALDISRPHDMVPLIASCVFLVFTLYSIYEHR